MKNYYNQLTSSQKKEQLAKCRFMSSSEFNDGVNFLKNKKIVIVGCGAQGLNQGLNMRDSGLNISYALRQSAIDQKKRFFFKCFFKSICSRNFWRDYSRRWYGS